MRKEISKQRRDSKTLKMKKINQNVTKSLLKIMACANLVFWARCRYRVPNPNNHLVKLDLNGVHTSTMTSITDLLLASISSSKAGNLKQSIFQRRRSYLGASQIERATPGLHRCLILPFIPTSPGVRQREEDAEPEEVISCRHT